MYDRLVANVAKYELKGINILLVIAIFQRAGLIYPAPQYRAYGHAYPLKSGLHDHQAMPYYQNSDF